MLPSVTALKFTSHAGVFGWLVRHGVDPLLIGSVLHRVNAAGEPPPSITSFSGGGTWKLAWRERSEGNAGPLPRFPEEETASQHGRSGAQATLRFRSLNGHLPAPGSFPRLL